MKILVLIIMVLISNVSISKDNSKERPVYYTVNFLSALIGPTKVDGQLWDPKSNANSQPIVSIISEMMLPGSGVTASTVVSTMSNIAPSGIAAPDVFGSVVVVGSTNRSLVNIAGKPLALVFRGKKLRDSYTPRFYAGYRAWPIYSDTRFRIQLWDADIFNDDNIAVVEINSRHLKKVALKNEPTWIDVSEQSMNQLLYLLISVTEVTADKPSTKMLGYYY